MQLTLHREPIAMLVAESLLLEDTKTTVFGRLHSSSFGGSDLVALVVVEVSSPELLTGHGWKTSSVHLIMSSEWSLLNGFIAEEIKLSLSFIKLLRQWVMPLSRREFLDFLTGEGQKTGDGGTVHLTRYFCN